jgi:hypothetical protein
LPTHYIKSRLSRGVLAQSDTIRRFAEQLPR